MKVTKYIPNYDIKDKDDKQVWDQLSTDRRQFVVLLNILDVLCEISAKLDKRGK